MGTNVEFKAYCADLQAAHSICESLNARLVSDHRQIDTYFAVSDGRLKLRESNVYGTSLIYYTRLDTPLAKESSFEIVPVERDSKLLMDLFLRAVGTTVTVSKHRSTYEILNSFINLDTVEDLGAFIEVEVAVNANNSLGSAYEVAEKLKLALRLSPSDLVPWSYAELKVMREAAKKWRSMLPPMPAIFLLDGASCAGKTTLATRLSQRDDLALALVPRYSTREPRGTVGSEPEYIFVSQKEFRHLAMAGAFIEYRDFMFGMSYGLPWIQTVSPVLQGRRAIGIIDLGNVRHIKSIFPEAVTILVAASDDTLRRRLIARGHNRSEEIEERLENARRVKFYEEFYDDVVENDEGMLHQAEEQIATIVRRRGLL